MKIEKRKIKMENNNHKILNIRRYKKYGYEVRTEQFEVEGNLNRTYELKSAYNENGDYIGNSVDAFRLCRIRGIKPEPSNEQATTCSIGFCEKEQKWYGWSHRAIYGFGIGDEVREGDCTAKSGWTEECLKEHPERDLSLPIGFKARNLDDAKRMAIAFADSVS